jgi:hypothetical protein
MSFEEQVNVWAGDETAAKTIKQARNRKKREAFMGSPTSLELLGARLMITYSGCGWMRIV